jgi:predicted metal-dependent hydrolase
MIPRNMRIDFTDVDIHWSKSNPAFSTLINAGSISAVAFEGYLNKVMAWARDELGGKKPALHRDINLFIAQEGHHYRVHKAYNKVLYQAYPCAREYEEELAGVLRRQFETKSLLYNLAFCVGFENFACYISKYQFSKALPFYEGADRRMATLWQWHSAEEFEHRAACSDALAAITHNYLARVRGLIVFLKLLLPWQNRLVTYMLEVDRAGMTAEQVAQSKRLKAEADRSLMTFVFPRMSQILLPFYDPRGQTAPQALHDALVEFEKIAAQPQPLAA